ncbi:hypothetical protein RIR_jg16216.t1 [Rhizophagus irregularis DAOM 181602=DAOM 197198]|nr:hypothetical protein RIR_jg16216.t1 [Rhizophagus irregularis DAOM 181602=DAOM 197198]
MCIPRIKSICASHCYGGWYGRFKKSQNLPLLHKVSFKLKKNGCEIFSGFLACHMPYSCRFQGLLPVEILQYVQKGVFVFQRQKTRGRLSRFKDRRYFVLYSYIHMLESTLIFQEIKGLGMPRVHVNNGQDDSSPAPAWGLDELALD